MSNPQLTGSDGEVLTPRELEPSELADSDAYDEIDSEDHLEQGADEREIAEAAEEKPDRIPHQLFYSLILALWIGVFAAVSYELYGILHIPFVGNLTLNARGTFTVNDLVASIMGVVLSYATVYLIYIPTAIFDKLFPTSTHLSMTQTYRKALKLARQFIRKINNAFPRRF